MFFFRTQRTCHPAHVSQHIFHNCLLHACKKQTPKFIPRGSESAKLQIRYSSCRRCNQFGLRGFLQISLCRNRDFRAANFGNSSTGVIFVGIYWFRRWNHQKLPELSCYAIFYDWQCFFQSTKFAEIALSTPTILSPIVKFLQSPRRGNRWEIHQELKPVSKLRWLIWIFTPCIVWLRLESEKLRLHYLMLNHQCHAMTLIPFNLIIYRVT